MKTWRVTVACGFASALAGCNSYPTPPLVFYQATTLGISASATGAGATPEFSLGYRDTDVAVVPVADSLGTKIRADDQPAAGGRYRDALSVLGQFSVNTTVSGTPTVGLGKFFATGLASQDLAEGFRDWQRSSLTAH
jgi:hypothetical protein